MPKINQRYFFLIFPIVILFSMTLATTSIFAQETVSVGAGGRVMGIEFKPQVPLPNFMTGPEGKIRIQGDGSTLYNYIIALYYYGASIAGLVAMFMIVLAGLKWLMAAGNPEKIATAKDMIQGSVLGLILLFGSYLLLVQISSSLVTFTGLGIKAIKRINVPAEVLGKCKQLANENACGPEGAFSLVEEQYTCPGGLRCSQSNHSCAISKGGMSYSSCTVEYMISQIEQGKAIDCSCVPNQQRYGGIRGNR